MDPVTIGAAISIFKALTEGGSTISREVREWRAGTRQSVGRGMDTQGQYAPLTRLAGGGVSVAPVTFAPQQHMAWGALHGHFIPADDAAAARLVEDEPALVLIWDVRADPALSSVVFSCELGGEFTVELPEGHYNVAAFVFDEFRDDIRGAALAEALYLAPNADCVLTLRIEVSDAESISHELFGGIGLSPAELVLPDGVSFPLAYVTTIGRSHDCNLVIDDPAVSYRHAQIEINDQGCWLHDLGSSHGCFVNGMRVAAGPLNHGDVVGIGDIEMDFRVR